MFFNYAQIDEQQRVFAVTGLHSEVTAPNLIALDDNRAHNGRQVQLGDLWTGVAFVGE